MHLHAILSAPAQFIAQAAVPQDPVMGPWEQFMSFLDTPAPYSPFTEYIVVLLLLWLLARRAHRPPRFEHRAQDVLSKKLAAGEIDQKTYDRYRAEAAMKVKK